MDSNYPKPLRLLLAAERVIARDGIEKASLKEAASIAYASHTSYSYYFGHGTDSDHDKKGVKYAVAEAIIQMRTEEIAPVVAKYADITNRLVAIPHFVVDDDGRVQISSSINYSNVDPLAGFGLLLLPMVHFLINSETSYTCRFTKSVWVSDPDLLLNAYSAIGSPVTHKILELLAGRIGSVAGHNEYLIDRAFDDAFIGMAAVEEAKEKWCLSNLDIAKEAATIMQIIRIRMREPDLSSIEGKSTLTFFESMGYLP